MDHNQIPKYYETEQRRELLDTQVGNQEIAMKAHFAQQFGHIAIRHANKEISDEDRNRFRELYIDKLTKHSLHEDRVTLSRDFDFWVDAMLPAALADIYEAKLEQENQELPEFISPKQMSEMLVGSDAELLRINQELMEKLRLVTEELGSVTAENSRFMNQLVGMKRELRTVNDHRMRLQESYDNLVVTIAMDQTEAAYSHSATVS
jgi:hypothetical protein